MADANYIRHPNPLLRGNPLIEGLGFPLSISEVQKRCDVPFVDDIDLSDVPSDLHGYYTRSVLGNLFDTHVCQDEAAKIYEVLRHSIEAGYRHRNPLSPEFNRVLSAIERDKTEPIKATNIERLGLFDTAFSYLLCGLSGRGKTMMVGMALKQIEQIIEHTEYRLKGQEPIPLRFTQVTYIYIEHHDRKGQKALLQNILEAIDKLTTENYLYAHRNSSVSELITAVRKAVIAHGIGTIIIDEAQNFAPSPVELKIGTNEKTSMKFVEEIFNRIGASLIFVGTFSTLELFSKEMTITRRTIRRGSLALASCDLNSSFWNRLCDRILHTGFMCNQVTPIGTLKMHLHQRTAGIPAIAVSLVQATLYYLTYMAPEQQDLSTDAIDHVFDEQFALLRAPIDALNHGEYHLFEDLKPMLLLKESKPDYTQEEGLLLAAKKLESRLMQGVVELVQQKPKEKSHEVDAKKSSEALAPGTLMKTLGYGE